jgi:putative ABC transport system ATP-binding protein
MAISTSNDGTAPLIRLRGIRKIYHMGSTDVNALAGVEMDIGPGEFVSITGPSGSGKSTMMGILGCLDRPTQGEYFLDGQPASELSEEQLAGIRNRSVGFVFQTFNLLPRTSAAENVAVPLFYARKIRTHSVAMEALKMVGLADRADHSPAKLSGGERQRVAIARAIVNNPKLILADEPTGNLDTHTGAQIMMIFHALHARGVTIVLVTHETDIAVQAQRIIQMRDGKILHDGPVDPQERAKALALTRALAEEKQKRTDAPADEGKVSQATGR